MKYNLNLNERAFNAIINKTKRIEIFAFYNRLQYFSFFVVIISRFML